MYDRETGLLRSVPLYVLIFNILRFTLLRAYGRGAYFMPMEAIWMSKRFFSRSMFSGVYRSGLFTL